MIAESRPNFRTNHLSFLACHVLDARCFLLRLLGRDAENPFSHLLDGASGIEEVPAFPPVEDVLRAWQATERELEEALRGVPAEDLDGEAPGDFPVDDPSLLGAVSFLASHESYHVGQMGLIRKFHGLGPLVDS